MNVFFKESWRNLTVRVSSAGSVTEMKAVQVLVSHPNVAVSTLLIVMLTTVEMIKVSRSGLSLQLDPAYPLPMENKLAILNRKNMGKAFVSVLLPLFLWATPFFLICMFVFCLHFVTMCHYVLHLPGDSDFHICCLRCMFTKMEIVCCCCSSRKT